MEVCKRKTGGLPAVGGEGVEFCGGAVVIRLRRASHLHRVGHFERVLSTEQWGSLCTLEPWGAAAYYQFGLWNPENILVQNAFSCDYLTVPCASFSLAGMAS